MRTRIQLSAGICAAMGLAVSLTMTACVLVAGQPAAIEEHFDADPQWDGFRNRLMPEKPRLIKQDFGYCATNRAGGKKAGEIGGHLQRAFTAASYAMPIRTLTLNDRLEATGTFSVTHASGGSGAMFGWFNKDSKGWRTPNSLTFRIDGNGGNFRVFYEYGTRNWRTGGGGAFEGDRYQTTPTKPLPTDGAPHTWLIVYDPEGNEGHGIVHFTLDGKEWEPIRLPPGHKEDGAEFDRFGLFNVQIAGDSMKIYLDDVVVGGERFGFDDDPRWEGVGNRTETQERVVRPFHDFGFSPTNHAGGGQGEIGGIIFRDERPAYYAAEIEPRTLDDELFASGKIAFLAAGSDSGVNIGWFESASKRNKTTPEHEARQPNSLGVVLEGPSRAGHYFRASYSSAAGSGVAPTEDATTGHERPIVRPDAKVHAWSLHYDPRAAAGNGRITVSLDGDEHTLDLRPEHRRQGATFDRFGFFNLQAGGHHVQVYLDDVRLGGRR